VSVCFYSVSGTNISLDYLKELFLLSLISYKEILIVIDLNDVFCFVLTVFLMILESTAAEEEPFSSYLIVGTGVRLDLRRIMLEDRAYRPVPPKTKKKLPRPQTTAKTKYSWHANRGPHFTGGWDKKNGARLLCRKLERASLRCPLNAELWQIRVERP
jgi:hypothetical protein